MLLLSWFFDRIFWTFSWCKIAVFFLSNSLIWISINEVRLWDHGGFHFCLIFSIFKKGSSLDISKVILKSWDTIFFFRLIFLLFFLCLCSCCESKSNSTISISLSCSFSFQSRYLSQSSSLSLLYGGKLVETLIRIEWFLNNYMILSE